MRLYSAAFFYLITYLFFIEVALHLSLQYQVSYTQRTEVAFPVVGVKLPPLFRKIPDALG